MTETTGSGVPEQMRTEDPRNPFEDAELVIYTMTAGDAVSEPTHPALQDLNLWSWSLWARWEDEGVEVPLLGESSGISWFSLSQESFYPNPADPISDAFVMAVAQMADDSIGGGWGDFDKEYWDAMPDVEKYILQNVRRGFLNQESETPALLIDWWRLKVV